MEQSIEILPDDMLNEIVSRVEYFYRWDIAVTCKRFHKAAMKFVIPIINNNVMAVLFERGDFLSILYSNHISHTGWYTSFEILFDDVRNERLIKLLIKRGARCDMDTVSHAYKCGYSKFIDIVSKLENIRSYYSFAAHGYARAGKINQVKEIIKSTAVEIDYFLLFDGACESDNLELMKYILNFHQSRESADRFICNAKNIDIIKYLVTLGADINRIHIDNICHEYNMDVIEYLISQGISVNKLLKPACRYGHTKFVEYLIQKGAANWNEGLLGACYAGNKELISFFINKGASNFNDCFIQALIGQKMDSNTLDILKLLNVKLDGIVMEVIDVFITFNYGDTSIINFVFGLIPDELKDEEFHDSCFSRACEISDYSLMKRFMESGAKTCECEKELSEHFR